MSLWKKSESGLQPSAEQDSMTEILEKAGQLNAPEKPQPDTAGDAAVPGRPVADSPRHTKSGRRKGQSRAAAPLGFAVLILAVVGVIFLVTSTVNFIKNRQDNTELKKELYYFIQPLFYQNPPDFTDPDSAQSELLIRAAVNHITSREYIRMTKDQDFTTKYANDELDRIMIPVSEVEHALRYLFGPEVKIRHTSIAYDSDMSSYSYDADGGFYHVPLSLHESMYVPLIDKVTRRGSTYRVRVGYVANINLTIDDNGEDIPPTANDADFFRIYTLIKLDDNQGWMIKSVTREDIEPEEPPADTSFTGNGETGVTSQQP